MRVLAPADLRGLGARGLDDLLEDRACTVAIGSGDLHGEAAAAFLFADYAALHRDAVLHLDAPAAWAGAVWRVQRAALRLPPRLESNLAREVGLCDEIIESEDWFDGWMRHRSATALDAAALLIRSRGGDALERAEFARLFATGEPAEGLAAFLEKRRPSFIVRDGDL
jgi:hypothetical protein